MDYALTGQDTSGTNHKVLKIDAKIVNRLFKYNSNDDNNDNKQKKKVPEYVLNLFDAFQQKKKEIKIVAQYMFSRKFTTFGLLFFIKDENYSMKINDVCKVFKNCKQITIDYY